MQGLADRTNKVFEAFSKLECLKGYTLVGGTALSLQIGKRLSEDLDFCKWSTQLKMDKPTMDWITAAGKYSNHRLKSKDALNFLSNSNNYKKEKKFKLLNPAYDIDEKDIEELIKTTIKKEYLF